MSVLQTNGIELYYEVEGNGEPLLLLHGMTGSHEDWEYAGRQEFLRKYRLITPDARWHGRSTNPEKTFSHRHCAHDTLALLDHLGMFRLNSESDDPSQSKNVATGQVPRRMKAIW